MITTTNTNSAESAEQFIGLHEYRNRKELKSFLGVDPVRTEWCAAFVNATLEMDNTPSLNTIQHKYPLTARAFLDWGVAVDKDNIQQGDLVIFPRGSESWQGHVGFYVGSTDNYWIILGGNQDNTVSYKLFKPKRAIGIRRWVE